MKKSNPGKVLVAMSGGVDSTVAVKLLRDKGYEVSGATMKLLPGDDERVERTQRLAEAMRIEFFVFDFTEEFRNEITDTFAENYVRGLTPNPCVLCNKKFKFGKFLEKATELGFEYIATGHYARITVSEGEYELRMSEKKEKDQSYFLFNLTQKELPRVLFPLENISKEETRKIAAELGLCNAGQKDSQDICFVDNGEYMQVVEDYLGRRGEKLIPGKFVDVEGKILAPCPGIEKYTIGQRKGVGVALGGEKPLYVVSKDPERREVVMGEDKFLYNDVMKLKNVTFVNEKYASFTRAEVKPRYAKKPSRAEIVKGAREGELTVKFDEPVRAITPGQYAVLYSGDIVLGGGEIV